MSSGKPQTRGLAALLRIEKERREREESAAAAESAAPPPDEGEVQPGKGPVAPEQITKVDSPSGEKPAEAQAEAVGFETHASSASVPQPGNVTPVVEPSYTGGKRQEAAGETSEPVTSLPHLAPASAVPAGQPAKKARTSPAPAAVADPGWEKFAADWGPFLRQGVKFKLCEFFYRNTVAQGRREFKTSTAQLSRVSGAHRRHIFLVLRQLEGLRFIQKESIETNRKDEGLLIRFFPNRQS
jgi:hypothetical protein